MNKNLIIIPTYNERDNLPIILEKIFRLMPNTHVLIVDDNSPDKTGEIAKELQDEYPNLNVLIRYADKGLGKAYVDGFKKALNQENIITVTMMDCDLSHDPKDLVEMINLSAKYDLVIGSRYVSGGGVAEKWETWRKILSRGANIYLRIIFRYPIKDWTGGYNIIKKEKLEKIDLSRLSPKGYAFISSLKYYLTRASSTVKEYPIIFGERANGESKMSSSIISEGIIAPWKIILNELFH